MTFTNFCMLILGGGGEEVESKNQLIMDAHCSTYALFCAETIMQGKPNVYNNKKDFIVWKEKKLDMCGT